jgi:transcriptional regulator with XRE-family HTH domain
MDDRRLGAAVRTLRIRRKWRQVDLATEAKLARSTISRVEHGHAGALTVATLRAVFEALEVSLDIRPRWQGGDLDRLLNARHSAMHEAMARWLRDLPEWTFAPEVSFSEWGERGVIDVLAWHAATATVLVIELKSEFVDLEDLLSTMDRRIRLAPTIAMRRGWTPRQIAAWVVLADTSTNRRRLAEHSVVLRAAFPQDGRSVHGWLASPDAARPMRALSLLPSARLGGDRRLLVSSRRVRRPRRRSAAGSSPKKAVEQ